jgi:peptidyl-prolyl cis-trans isomerase B (cyclophilin B)
MLAGAGELDGQYAVFGKVTSGMEVVDRIALGDKMKTVKIVEASP